MKLKVVSSIILTVGGLLLAITPATAQSNLAIRVMAANITSGNGQSYLDPGIRIFQGLKPDVVCIQEFNYGSDSTTDIRAFVDTAFGPDFQYFRETQSGYDIPNGVISRWPIKAAGSWDDASSPNRGFAWAKIELPGTNYLYVVSVHLLTANESTRAAEAAQLKTLIQSEFPTNAWVVIGGDMNTGNRGETAITTFKTFLSDHPVPSDGRSITNATYTNAGRSSPYDYVLTSFPLANYLTPVVLTSHTYPSGLVFDSRQYPTLSDVAPVLSGDSGAVNMQHMAVIKDFLIPVAGLNTNPPSITTQPLNQTNALGGNVTFSVVASGATPLAYQWRLYSTNLLGATANGLSLTNIQPVNAGDYTVVITNAAGSITSMVATLTITTSPVITNQPQSLALNVGDTATFTVGVTGLLPLSYQWHFNQMAVSGATNASFVMPNLQLLDTGDYTVIITNDSGSVTSSIAVLTVNPPLTGGVIAQWNFNSAPPDGVLTTGTTAPSIGTGTAVLAGGTTATFATGDTALDPAGTTDNTGWNTASYPTQGTANKARGVQFNVSTVGKQNISVTWSVRLSGTASKYSRLQYSTNGTDFFDYPIVISLSADSVFERKTNNLSAITGVNNNPSFAIRIVSEFESTAIGNANANYVTAATGNYGPAGTMRYDVVTVLGNALTPLNPPAASPTLTNAILIGDQFQFMLVGTATSNYVVQTTTDLNNGSWVPLRTNAAPFLFVETNALVWPQRFYRGMVAP